LTRLINFAPAVVEANRVVRPGRWSIALAVLALAVLPAAAANADIVVTVSGVTTTSVAAPRVTVPAAGTVSVDLAGLHISPRGDVARPPTTPGGGKGGVVTTPPVTTPPVTTPPVSPPPVTTPPVATPPAATAPASPPAATTAAAVAPAVAPHASARPAPTAPTGKQAATPAPTAAPTKKVSRPARTNPSRHHPLTQPAVVAPRHGSVPARHHDAPTRATTRRQKASPPPVPRHRVSHSRRGAGGGVSRVGIAIGDVVEQLPGWILVVFLGFAALAAGMAVNAYAHSRRAGRLAVQRAELVDDVGELQAALLAPLPAARADVAFSVAYRPAAGLAAGGDFYDVFELDGNRTALVLGDVSGHGRESVAQAALVRFTLRTFIAAGEGPAQAIALTDPCLDGHMEGQFATVIAAIYDHAAHTLTYAKAGHHPPLILGLDGESTHEQQASPPIGAGLGARPADIVLYVPPGATVCFFTDGLVEARRRGEPLGAERVAHMLAERPDDAGALITAVAADADQLNDDLAVCLLHRPAESLTAVGPAPTPVGDPVGV
jgi:Stage II sporulation protein E (SpoIIE)